MTKFITFFNLCPIQDPKEFLGIAPDKEEGNIITTLGKNIIVIIKISTQKQRHSWTVVEKLSAKVVYDYYSQKYVGVFANYYIRCWDENSTDINKCKKLKFQKSIADLITDGEHTFILYTDGTCEELSAAIQSRKSEASITSKEHELKTIYTYSDAKVSTTEGGRRILTYFRRCNETDELDLIYFPLDTAIKKSLLIKRDFLDTKCVGYAVIEGDNAPLLMTVWSDKRIFLLNLNDDLKPEQSPGNFVSMLSVLDAVTPLSVLGISRHFVAIYGSVTGLKGASIILYNTQFKVIKAKQYFKAYFNFSKLWSADNSILIAMGQNLSMVTYRTSKELLTDLVGTQTNNDFQTVLEGDHINEEESLEYSIQFSNEEGNKEKLNFVEAMKTIHYKMANGKSIPYESTENFDRTLNELGRLQMHVDVVQTDAALENDVLLMSNFNDDGFVTPEVQLIASQLEKCGASEHEITEKLLLVLMKADLLQDIAICIRRYTNISEKVLAKTLNYLLSKYTPKPEKSQTETDNVYMDVELNLDDEVDQDEFPNLDLLAQKYQRISTVCEIDDVLNLLLACTFDSKIMAVHIRKEINYDKILLLLKHLYKVINSSEESFEELPTNINMKNIFEFELQIMRWFSTVFDAHFTQLAMSKDINLVELLYQWHIVLNDYRREAEDLETTAALLYNITRKQELPKNRHYSEWYSIEDFPYF